MKRVFAIAMLATLMFNIGGYTVLFKYFIKQTDEVANRQISKGLYNPEELVEIKIPMRMPYIQEQKEYETISGQIELKGHNYNYVALRITRDTMYVKCVPNYEKTRLINENVISAKEVSDVPLQKKNHQVEKKSGIDEYNYSIMLYAAGLNGTLVNQSYICTTAKTLPNAYLAAPAQPPEQGILA